MRHRDPAPVELLLDGVGQRADVRPDRGRQGRRATLAGEVDGQHVEAPGELGQDRPELRHGAPQPGEQQQRGAAALAVHGQRGSTRRPLHPVD
ncbi:hypothetical protein PGN05_13215 [Geodermatophilus sp. CPCC 206100]